MGEPTDSPSLRPYLEEIHPSCLKNAIAAMSELFNLPDKVEIPLENALDNHWLPS